jgi:hypothetical protein
LIFVYSAEEADAILGITPAELDAMEDVEIE